MVQTIALLGSTGSIGTQSLDVISRYPGQFRVSLLTAWNNVDLLTRQALKFNPESVVIGNKDHLEKLRSNLRQTGIKVYGGSDETDKILSSSSAETVIASIVGYSGLRPVISAIRAGKKIALANKETLVVAGEIITSLAAKTKSTLIPVDSEHSAIFQCLVGEKADSVEKITLTASGGPFLGFNEERLLTVKPQDALRHPNWSMGDKVTIDSASMMNKGLEVIEARWLFGIEPSKIDVVIHPQSIIHSFVHFRDGSVKAQLGIPDMRLPILYALSYPSRINSDLPRLEFADHRNLTFEPPDTKRFRNLALAFGALKAGGNMPCVLNASNEVAVRAFLDGSVGFMDMPDVVEYTLEKTDFINNPDLEGLERSDCLARDLAIQYINEHIKTK